MSRNSFPEKTGILYNNFMKIKLLSNLSKSGKRRMLMGVLALSSVFLIYDWWFNGVNKKEFVSQALSTQLYQDINKKNLFPEKIYIEDDAFNIEYTFNKKLQNYAEKLLEKYLSDLSSVVIIENSTGKILVATGWEKTKGRNLSLAFTSKHPTASLAKIITSADLLENAHITNETIFNYRGRANHLYRYQLRDKFNRWTQFISFEKAFALSNNVVFGKAAIKNTSGTKLREMATEFGFNTQIMDEIPLHPSRFNEARSSYHLAELASGLNRETLMSPIHAALLASIIAYGGVRVTPRILQSVESNNFNLNDLYPPRGKVRVLAQETAKKLKKMMRRTVTQGTARKIFRRMNTKIKNQFDLGGKTGSITGGEPHGKRDWFIMYAIPKDNPGKGISLAIMNINLKKWFVKSSYLALKMVEYYHKNIHKGVMQK